MKPRATTWSVRRLGIVLAAGILSLFTGCGGEQTTAVFDATALLERIEQDRRRHDPHAYSEVDLGTFTVTWRREPSVLIIRFHLYAVVSDNELEECHGLLATHGERVRSTVRETVQGSDAEQIEDPTLGWLKSELIQSINESLQAPIIRDVAFDEFALDRG